jgi:hypothetical protein
MRQALDLFDLLSEEQAVARPRPGAWSPAECLDHLTITADAFREIFDAEIARAAKRSDRPYVPGWLGRWFIRNIEGPAKRRYQAPARFVPPSPRSGAESLAAFLASHETLLARIPQLAPLDLRRIRVTSPFAAWMTYPLGLVCYLVPAHCRRHLEQARRA